MSLCQRTWGFPDGLQYRRPGFDPWVGKIPRRREQLPLPVLLLGECHRQRSLACYSSWGHKESDTTERLTLPLENVVPSVHFYLFFLPIPKASLSERKKADINGYKDFSYMFLNLSLIPQYLQNSQHYKQKRKIVSDSEGPIFIRIVYVESLLYQR